LSKAPNVSEVELKSPANGPGTMWWMPRMVDLSGVEIFHAPFNILPSGLKMRTLATVHDIMWITNPDWCNPKLYGHIERKFYSYGIKQAFERADRIATVSAATRSAILELEPSLAAKTRVTFSGVSSEFRPVDVDPAKLDSLGLPAGKSFVLTAGQFAPYKNHEGAIAAFATAFADRSDIDLVMVQRRNHGTRKLRALTERLGIADRVHFAGAVDKALLLQLYSGALALLHPSFCEGFGNPVAEAMACGCPVVTSNVSAMPEVADGAALLVDPYDATNIAAALREVTHDEGLSNRLRSAGIARARELSWKQFAQQNIAIYRELLETS
jgi:glycosyltransferase involved in cell wall biosynthesis